MLAAMSQYANSIGMPFSSGIVTTMMNDASDGVMNGRMGGNQLMMGGTGGGMMGTGNNPLSSSAGTSGLASAMVAFMGSVQNKSGLTFTDMQALHDKIHASSGQIQ